MSERNGTDSGSELAEVTDESLAMGADFLADAKAAEAMRKARGEATSKANGTMEAEPGTKGRTEPTSEAAPPAPGDAGTEMTAGSGEQANQSTGSTGEIERLTAEIAERDKRIAEIQADTKRQVDQAYGRQGYELDTLRGQVRLLTSKLEELTEQNAILKKAAEPLPPSQEEPTLEEEAPEFASLAAPLQKRLNTLKAEMDAIKRQHGEQEKVAAQKAEADYAAAVRQAVPNIDERLADPAFVAYMDMVPDGDDETRRQKFERFNKTLNAPAMIRLLSSAVSAVGQKKVAAGTSDGGSGPPKPSVEGQVVPGRATAGTPQSSKPRNEFPMTPEELAKTEEALHNFKETGDYAADKKRYDDLRAKMKVLVEAKHNRAEGFK